MTIDDRYRLADGRPSGFDYLRFTLALMVLANHAPLTAYGLSADALTWSMPWLPTQRLIIPMFFALSGFLVAGSFERSKTLLMFFGLRAIRIFPALCVETLWSALILGVIFTSLPLAAYFSDPLFFRYFLNILGEPQYFLPGVFAKVPNPGVVNLQLWTIPFELACYLAMGAVGVMGGRKRRWLPLALAAAITLAYYLARLAYWGALADIHRSVPGPLVVVAFLVGVALYSYRQRLNSSLAMTSVMLGMGMLLLSLPGEAQLLAPWPVAYATVCLGCLNPPRTIYTRGADYSYGIYLYGLPTQQALAASGNWSHNVWIIFFGSLAIAGTFAALSWIYVERPALGLRGKLKVWEDRWLVWRASRLPGRSAA